MSAVHELRVELGARAYPIRIGRGLLGDAAARVPAVRRLDSLLLVGPAWALAAYALL